MAIAARIAAVTVFCNRYAVWIGIDLGDVPDEDITIQALCGGSESIDSEPFLVHEIAVREALSTGLFSSYGSHQIGWAHQTYAEFLAAWYLKQHEMPLIQMMSLIVHPGDRDGKLVPQLHETAAWLASIIPDIFREILKIEPDVLLRSDVATADVKDKEALVENLLKLHDEDKLINGDLNNYRRYRKLKHPGLLKQLQPYIFNVNKSVQSRYIAINVAEVCELQELQEDLVNVALNSLEPLQIRINAVSAICRIGNDEAKTKLKPLAIGETENAINDELQHYALEAVWPKHITAEELFAAITPSKSAYQYMLRDLVQHLQPTDLPIALEWLEKQNPLHHTFEELANAIMLKAWKHFESPKILEGIVKIALSQLQDQNRIRSTYRNSFFRDALNNLHDEKRRRLLEAILPRLLNLENDLALLAYTETPIILPQDFKWLIERLQASQSKQIQSAWTRLIRTIFDSNKPGHCEAVIVASQSNLILAEEFAWLLQPIKLDSPQAQEMRNNYLEIQKQQERHQTQRLPSLEPPPAERIVALLNIFESGDLAAWWSLNMEMTLNPDSNHYDNEIESDLTVLPGWNAANATTRARIVAAAKKYILEQEPETQEWLRTNTLNHSAVAGYRALRLVMQESPEFVSTIPADVWKRWASIILAYPTFTNVKDKEYTQMLLKIAYQYAATEIIDTLILLVDKENEEYGFISIISKIESCWDNTLANALLAKTKDEKLKLSSMECLLTNLFRHKVQEAVTFAKSVIGLPPRFSGYNRSKAIVAAYVLINNAEDAGWSVVWPAIQRDYKFGRKVVEMASYSDKQAINVGQTLSENQLANLYIWLAHQYPYSEDPKYEGIYSPGPRDNIIEWKNSVLRHLQERGTAQACKEIQSIIKELPELDWLKWTLLQAQNIARRKTWMPPQPSEILELTSNEQGRFVQSGEQLLEVLIESLIRLEAELQGETPSAIFLWDHISGNDYKPKDENTFSDYVKLHLERELKQRGIIVNREVEIRRNRGFAPGERTDIQVDAIVPGANGEVYGSITAIIEVKGCWNKDLNEAIETQLLNRYLKDNSCQHGLYLVGWFNCNQWDKKNDYRKGEALKLGMDINAVRKKFDDQATELSQLGLQVKAYVLNAALR